MNLDEVINKNMIMNNNPDIEFSIFKEESLQLFYSFDLILNENTDINKIKTNPIYYELFNLCENTIKYKNKYKLSSHQVIHNLYFMSVLWYKEE